MNEDKNEKIEETNEEDMQNNESLAKEKSKPELQVTEIKENSNEEMIQQDITEQKENIEEDKKQSEKIENIKSEGYAQNVGKRTAKREKKRSKLLFIISVMIVFAIVFSTIFAIMNINNTNILTGISIKGIDISGLSKEEATEKLNKIVDDKLSKEVNVKYEEYEATISPAVMEASFDVQKAVEQAYEYGREGNIIKNNYDILIAMLFNKNIPMDVQVDRELAINAIEDMGSKIPGHVIQYSYYIEGETLVITRGTPGLKVLLAEMYQNVYENLNDLNTGKDFIMIPVENVEPADINIDEIHKAIYKEPKDAYYETDPFTIYPEVDGVNFDLEAARNQISHEYKDEYEIELQITKAEHTTDDIGKEAFPDVLATFTTKYDASNKNRSTNLALAAGKINGVVLMPGEEFSYNKVVGERTIEAGYKEAKIYSNGKVIDGLGGGICQVSSTLYNSVLQSNLEITERHNHQFVTSYVAAGKDATVVWGVKDFKFVNNRNYPIKIETSVKNGICKISIYGVKEEIEYNVEIEVETISVKPYSTKYEENDKLEAGIEKIKQNGTNGRVTATYKVLSKNGMIVSRTLLSKDTYNAMQKIIIKGTKETNKETKINNNNSTSVQ